MAFLEREALIAMGFAAIGDEVYISDKASIHNAAAIALGSRVRIDDFCVLSAGAEGIFLGDSIHVATHSTLIGRGRITLSDYANISGRVSIYSSTDDFSGASMTSPMVPDEFRRPHHAAVHVGRHAIVGCGSVILPGSVLEDGVAVGAMSLVKGRCHAFGIYAGIPATRIRERSHDLLRCERELSERYSQGGPGGR